MTYDNQTQSLHYYHSFGAEGRVNLCNHSSAANTIDKSTVDYTKFVPSNDDKCTIEKNMHTIVSWILVQEIPALRKFSRGVKMHIDHKYSQEMAKKSNVVRTHQVILLHRTYCNCVSDSSWSDFKE